ncbi:MAG TPA: S-layer homology domain-containing protein, partial [Blastocatellia bacterium]|nr:S-layer homology domain-containing protein [Blastocatellia bacterium]
PSDRNNEDQRGLFVPQGPAEDKGSGEWRSRVNARIEPFDMRLLREGLVTAFARLEEDSPAGLPLNDNPVTYEYEGTSTEVTTNFNGIAKASFFVDPVIGSELKIKVTFPGTKFHNAAVNSIKFKIFADFRPSPGSSTPGGAGCQFLIFDADQSFAANGGTGTINVRTFPQTCNWTAVSNDPWIQITSGASGTGDGEVTYTVSSHTDPSPRSGSITVAGITYNVLQGAAFLDVPQSDIFYTFIGKLSARGVTSGCGGGNYCPNQPVLRDQMAAFILRALGEFNPPTPAQQRFSDVPPTNIFYNFIDRLAELQITSGCGGGNYCPSAPVLRDQMAAFMIRAVGEPNPAVPFEQRFADVAVTSLFSAFIEEMAIRRITAGCTANMYCPSSSVTRGQMAVFLVNAFGL